MRRLNIGAEHPGFEPLNTSRHATSTAVSEPLLRHSAFETPTTSAHNF